MLKLVFWATLIYFAYRYFTKNKLQEGKQGNTIHHHHHHNNNGSGKAKEENGDYIDYEEIK
jgi:hypothetical protein